VALKVLLRKLLDDPEFLLRFQNEAASTGRIRHPNVVTIYESGQGDDGTPYIAMEYLEGETLRHALKTRGALPVPECGEILQQVAHGLNAAHKLGIIHRDLKPDNIFLTRGDEAELIVKVVDFGIAKLRESTTHTLTGTVLGTPAYMSFEQASGMRSDDLDARSDIYSLGVVVYEMLTGRVPFQSDTPVGYLRKHLQDVPPTFSTVKPDLPALPAVERVVMRALTKDREQRYASALVFSSEFSRAASTPAQSEELRPTERVVGGFPGTTQAEPERLKRDAVEAERREKERAEAERLARIQEESKRRGAEKPRVVTKQGSRAKYVGLVLVGLAIVIGATWFRWLPQIKLERQHGAERRATIERSGAAAAGARLNPKDDLKYVWIPPGTFMMGCSPGDTCRDDENPSHQVTITKGFWLGQTEVTAGAYKRFAGSSGRQMPAGPNFNDGWSNSGWADENQPIMNVTWDDAQAYCDWGGGRLPTEAEWEYAARGGSTEARYGPLDEVAWYGDNCGGQTHDVAQKRANGFGLYDMLGNVWEWANDRYGEQYYQNSPEQDPPGPGNGQLRVLRGGSWGGSSEFVRVSCRLRFNPADKAIVYGGFRCRAEMGDP
jgi:eukaryotic-like serine/threonine-protein kinase